MDWKLEEAIGYYKKQGAPGDQSALTALMAEVQQENGGGIPSWTVPVIAGELGVKESLLLALIRRIPRLRLAERHLLEICAGPNCGRHAALAKAAERLKSAKIEVRFVPCQRMCGKGPNIRFDGKVYHKADEALLRSLTQTE